MSLLPVEDALARILQAVEPLGVEEIPLADAAGRILAEPLIAGRDQPPADTSAMDGYAVRGADVATAPATLRLIGTAPAGHGFGGAVGPGEAVRIFTGAPLPDGADTIVIQEDTRAEGDTVTVLEPAPAGRYVRRAGLDFRTGDTLLEAGMTLNARRIGLAAAMNRAVLPVRRRPRVAIMPTGDELVAPGETPRADQIVSSNNYALAAFVERYGAEALDLGIVRDDLDALRAAIARARGCDILVTLGGASVGDHDLVQQALAEEGLDLSFWRIAMRPGKPLMYGRLGNLRVLGLPGNPVSSLVCGRIFLKPLMDALLGRTAEHDRPLRARLGRDLGENDRRQDYLRATLRPGDDGYPVATPYDRQDSSMLGMLASADCLVVRAPFASPARAGDLVDIVPLDF